MSRSVNLLRLYKQHANNKFHGANSVKQSGQVVKPLVNGIAPRPEREGVGLNGELLPFPDPSVVLLRAYRTEWVRAIPRTFADLPGFTSYRNETYAIHTPAHPYAFVAAHDTGSDP